MAFVLLAIKDVKADAFPFPPFTSHNKATGERDFRLLLQDASKHLGRCPEDYELYRIGVWNEEVGVILAEDFPQLVIRGCDVPKEVR